MATNRISSKQIMNLLDDARNRIGALEDDAATMKLNMDSRLSVIRNIQEYEEKQMKELTSLVDKGRWIEQANKIVLVRSDIVEGVYDIFGSTVHPKFLKEPNDIFNFKTVGGYSFKDNAVVSIDGIIKPRYKAMLMHDSITGQDICFDEFDNNRIELSVKINPGELLGTTEFNVIEIMPYLPGSFKIESLDIYSLQSYYMNDDNPDSSMPGEIKNVGVCRLLTDDKYNLYELKMKITLNFKNSNGKYPFGLKHLYFLNAEMNTESFVVCKIKQNKYIDTISEELTVVDQTGIVETTCREENIELFTDYASGIGIDAIATSKGLTNNPIPRDIKEFYMKYPIQRSTVSVQFNDINLR